MPPVVYNWSLGAQREVGWNVVGDVAYVGNAARHQPISRELNGRPYGYAYQPSSLDPTNVINGQAQPLPDDLLRPYRGYSSILQREFTGYADYHSLQVLLTRRLSRDGFSGGVAYTYQIVNRSLGADRSVSRRQPGATLQLSRPAAAYADAALFVSRAESAGLAAVAAEGDPRTAGRCPA